MEKLTKVLGIVVSEHCAIIYENSDYEGFTEDMHVNNFTYGLRITNPKNPLLKEILKQNLKWRIKCLIFPLKGNKEFLA